jgi:hypothetical protein
MSTRSAVDNSSINTNISTHQKKHIITITIAKAAHLLTLALVLLEEPLVQRRERRVSAWCLA